MSMVISLNPKIYNEKCQEIYEFVIKNGLINKFSIDLLFSMKYMKAIDGKDRIERGFNPLIFEIYVRDEQSFDYNNLVEYLEDKLGFEIDIFENMIDFKFEKRPWLSEKYSLKHYSGRR